MTHDLLANGALDLATLARLTARPALFAPHESLFWNDPHIAAQMLAAHLDPSHDAASRRPETIDRIVEWIVSGLDLAPGARVLDLGCGPGLYCRRLAARGLDVTGVDFSEGSLAHARAEAGRLGLSIDYRRGDYLALPEVLGPDAAGSFDVATIIWCDLGVFADAERDRFLDNVRWALKPGGLFLCDVFTPNHPSPPDGQPMHSVAPDGQTSFAVHPSGGFWRAGPHLELTTTYRYPEADADLTQVVVAGPDGAATVYRIWNRAYTPATLTAALAARGLAVEAVWSDLAGKPWSDDSELLAVAARRA